MSIYDRPLGRAALVAALGALVLAAPARAACTVISTFPTVISSSGEYCLAADVFLSLPGPAPAIRIDADNVTLDLAGHKLRNKALIAESTATGIAAQDRANVTVRNGTIGGFLNGVVLTTVAGSGMRWALVEGILAVNQKANGLLVDGKGSVVRGNRVVQIGGTTLGPTVGCGIGVHGQGVRVLDNDIVDVTGSAGLAGDGICVAATDAQIVGNRISATTIGISFNPGGTGKYRDNLTTDVPLPFAGGTDAGNNN